MKLTKDECRFLSKCLSMVKYDIVSDEFNNKKALSPFITMANELQMKLSLASEDNRRHNEVLSTDSMSHTIERLIHKYTDEDYHRSMYSGPTLNH